MSLTLATVVTIFSGSTLPSHADRSCPLGFSAGSMGCQKVVKVTIKNICPGPRFMPTPRAGQDRCDSSGSFINYSAGDPNAKQHAVEKHTKDPDPGFTNPGAPIRQRKVVVTSEKVLIDHDSMTNRDYTEITLDIIILPSSP